MKIVVKLFLASLGLMIVAGIVFRIAKKASHRGAEGDQPPIQARLDASDDDDRFFDLIDMLPARAGHLAIIDAIGFKGILEPKSQQAHGHYYWVRSPGAADDLFQALPMSEAAVKCYRDDPRATEFACGGPSGKRTMVGALEACYFAADRKCKDSTSNASISWPGCTVSFGCEAWGKRTVADAVSVALDIERWASWFRGGRASIKPEEVKANRAVLLKARALALEDQRRGQRR